MTWRERSDWRGFVAVLLIGTLVLVLGFVLRAAGLGPAANVAQLVSLAPIFVALAKWWQARQPTTQSSESIVAYATLEEILADRELGLGKVQPTIEAVRRAIDNRLRSMRRDTVNGISDDYMRLAVATRLSSAS